jgi:hypothetical protein
MNFYEDESLEKKLDELSSHIGFFILDLLLAGTAKLNSENQIFTEFLECRLNPDKRNPPSSF